MMMKASNCSERKIALILRRAPSTITREHSRFAGHDNLKEVDRYELPDGK